MGRNFFSDLSPKLVPPTAHVPSSHLGEVTRMAIYHLECHLGWKLRSPLTFRSSWPAQTGNLRDSIEFLLNNNGFFFYSNLN